MEWSKGENTEGQSVNSYKTIESWTLSGMVHSEQIMPDYDSSLVWLSYKSNWMKRMEPTSSIWAPVKHLKQRIMNFYLQINCNCFGWEQSHMDLELAKRSQTKVDGSESSYRKTATHFHNDQSFVNLYWLLETVFPQ